MAGKIWLPIMEYSLHTGQSISTIRRSIRSNKVHFKKIKGKYYLNLSPNGSTEKSMARLRVENERLKNELRIKQERIDELTMLIRLYEKNN